MAVKSKEEILESLKTRMGENPDDDAISFLEDVSDTLTDFETRANGNGTDWKTKYETNDAEWRKKYTDRFFSSEPDDTSTDDETDASAKPKTFADLFKNE